MKYRTLIPVSLLLVAGLRAAAPVNTIAVAKAPQLNTFAVVKAQIDSLLEQRRQPPPFDPLIDNPFHRPGPALGEQAPAKTTVPVAKGSSNIDLIHRLGAQLHLSGTVNMAGRLQVIINSTVCDEGKMITVRDGEMVYRLLVARISPAAVTIQLGEAEMLLNLH